MKLLWSKSTKPLSIVIRAITGQDCSHFSFVFESAANGLVFESNLLGTHPEFLSTSLKSHTIVHEIDLPLSIEVEDKIWDVVVQKYDGKGYDYLGALYLGWRIMLYRIFRSPIPLINKWGQPDKYFCDEVYDCLNNIPNFPKIDVMSGMETPHDVWIKLNNIKGEGLWPQ